MPFTEITVAESEGGVLNQVNTVLNHSSTLIVLYFLIT